MPGDEGELLFASQSIRHVIRFKLSHCGPGYVHEGKRCHCSKNYSKIHCEPEKFAAIASNYWAGYISNENDSIATQYYHCRSAMICRDDLELRWRLLMCENEFSHISLLLYISTAF